jgi:hypothetical protein
MPGTEFSSVSIKLRESGIEPGVHLLKVFVTNNYGVSSDQVTVNVTLLTFVTDIYLDPNSHTVVSSPGTPSGSPGSESTVSSNQLTLRNELIMNGRSRPAPIDDDRQRFISDRIKIIFIGDGRHLPRIDLGAVGRHYSAVPSQF